MMFSSSILLADEVKAPQMVAKGETQIESSSVLDAFRNTPKARTPRLEEIKAEGKRIQAERVAKAKEAERLRLEQVKKQKELEAEKESYVQSKDGIEFNGSYYTAFCKEGCTGITATGYDVSDTIYYEGMRIIAVDPKVIPLKSIVEVSTPNETFTAIALDKGGAIKGKKIDILVTDTKTALRLGRHSVYIKVIESGE